MDAGEGVRIAAGIAGLATIVGTFVAAAVYAERQWRRMLAPSPVDEGDLSAEALVPEYAASRRPCGCDACRRRSTEPCSDYDGD